MRGGRERFGQGEFCGLRQLFGPQQLFGLREFCGLIGALWCLAHAPAVLAQAAPPEAPPGLTVTAEEARYDVLGTTAAEVGRSMRDRGPLEKGRRWDGYTYWQIDWKYRYAMRSGTCEITEVEVSYASRVVLPEWRASSGIPTSLRRDWDRYLSALRSHEDDHVAIGARAAREVLARIGALTSPSCSDIAARADRVGRGTLDEYRGLQQAYDVETGHGRTQGAVWPPARDRLLPL